MKKFNAIQVISAFTLGLGLVSNIVRADPTPANFSRKTVTLAMPSVVGGLSVAAGEIEIFEPGETLARGTLTAPGEVEKLTLPTGSALNFESPGRLATVHFSDDQPTITIAGYPFDARTDLSFAYGTFLARMRGKLIYHPNLVPGFPTAGLNPAAFENEIAAECEIGIDDRTGEIERRWGCSWATVYSVALPQTFGAQTVNIPAESVVTFGTSGIDSIQLAHDADFMGLPVSASAPIRIGRWNVDSPYSVSELTLAHDTEYQGAKLSAMTAVGFYSTGEAPPKLLTFAPADELKLVAGKQTVTVAALEEVHLNHDGSLYYGSLASPQLIEGNLYPAGAVVFFGSQAGTRLGSVGLQPNTSVTINGVTYGQSNAETLFIDFDEAGNVIRAR